MRAIIIVLALLFFYSTVSAATTPLKSGSGGYQTGYIHGNIKSKRP